MRLKDLTAEDIREKADSDAILDRGLDYFRSGHITSMKVKDRTIFAKVYGNFGIYNIEICIEDGEISVDCDCPYDGYGCKHIVAVLFKWISWKEEPETPSFDNVSCVWSFEASLKPKEIPELDIEEGLSGFTRDELQNILSTLSYNYEDVNRYLTLKICERLEDADKIKEIIFGLISDIFYQGDGFFNYDSQYEIARSLDEIRESILKYPPDIRAPLIERLITKCKKAHEQSHEWGIMGDIVIEGLFDFGKSIREQDLPFEEKRRVIEEYFDLLEGDEQGLENGYINFILEIPSSDGDFEYLIKMLKARLNRNGEDYRRKLYRDMLTEVYKRVGRDDEYLALLEEDARKDGRYLPLAKFWIEKGDMEKAIDTAEEGIKAKTIFRQTATPLFDFLKETYRNQNDSENLLRILILDFKETPSLERYEEIMEVAEGQGQWGELKGELLQDARRQALIEILLFEGELEKAFDELMNSQKHYYDGFKDKVARELAFDFPERAITIYKSIVTEFINGAKRKSYRIAARYAKKVRQIYLITDKKEEWDSYISLIRIENRRRPALIDEFRRL